MAGLVEFEKNGGVRVWFTEIGGGTARLLLPFPDRLMRADDLIIAMRHLAPRLRRQARGMPRRIRPLYVADEVTGPTGHRWVAFGRPVGRTDVDMVPDTYFLRTFGFTTLRRLAGGGHLPDWREREDVLFWRGSPTGVSDRDDLMSAPRIRLVTRHAGVRGMDLAICSVNGLTERESEQLKRGLAPCDGMRPALPMADWARYRYVVDIDGNCNAWGFFEKLLAGSCVLKVATPLEQWFYHHLQAGVHYVPVRADLSDLAARLDWCRRNPQAAETIARNGQAFALAHTFDTAMDETAAALAGPSDLGTFPPIPATRWRSLATRFRHDVYGDLLGAHLRRRVRPSRTEG